MFSFGKMFSHPESDEIELILEIINESTFESRLQKIALTADHNSGEKRPKIIGFTYSSCLKSKVKIETSPSKKYQLLPFLELPFVKFASFTMVR